MRTTLALVAGAAAFQRPTLRTRAPALQARQGADLEKDAGGLYYVDLQPESGASAKVFVFGADVTSYKDADGTEWVGVRPDAKMDGSKPISGGLSHCFPQFGPGAIQQHGFARNVDWDVVSTTGSSATFRLAPSDYSRAMWDEHFNVDFTVSLTGASLDTKMVVTNTGDTAWDFQAALHSYFDVSSLKNIEVAGSFAGKTFLNKMKDPPADETEAREALVVAEEYDRVYKGVNDCTLKDSGKGKSLKIDNGAGWTDTVVWSPYGDEGMGFDTFLCVESAAFDAQTLAGGASWVGELSLAPGVL